MKLVQFGSDYLTSAMTDSTKDYIKRTDPQPTIFGCYKWIGESTVNRRKRI